MEFDDYSCYYCRRTFSIYKELIAHLCETHPDLNIKYKQCELDHETGKLGFRTKFYPDCSPRNRIVTVTEDNRLSVTNVDRSKKKKINTPQKAKKFSTQFEMESDSGDEKEQSVMAFQLESLDINESIDDTDDNDDDSMDHDMKSLIEMLPSVLETLKIHNQLSTYMKWCKLLKEGTFPLDNICYMLFLDLAEWFDKPFTSQMRYLREDTRQFWEVGYRLFKGKFIRFMAGPRNFGQIVDGSTERGFCTPQKAKINFPVPSVKTLTHNKLVPIYPGIIIDTIEHIAKYLPSKIIKIGIDGEKNARGKGKQMGDVNCWGHEPAPTLHEKQQRLEDEKVFIQETKTNVEKCDHTGTGTDKLTTTTKVYLLQKLKSIVTVVSKRIKDLRDVSLKLNFGIQKFVKLGEVTGDWRKSKYAPVVSSLKVGKYDIDQAIGKGLTLVNELGHISSTLNGAQNHYSKSGDVDMTHQLNYHQLYQNYQTQDSRYVKQRTDQWFTFRSEALVTGSTCNNALGLGRLKQQQSHYDKVVLGKPENRVFTEEQKQNMEYGTLHEIDGIATVVGRILPAFYPNVEYFEEGCVRMSLDDQQSFFVVSPDGSLKKNKW